MPARAETRTNLEIIDESGVTEILEPGANRITDELRQCGDTLKELLNEASEQPTVIFSGSLPEGVPSDIYKTLIELVHNSRVGYLWIRAATLLSLRWQGSRIL